MIGLEVRGVSETQRRLSQVPADLDDAERQTVQQGSIIARRKLVERMSRSGGSDPFWGRRSPEGAYLGSRSGKSRQRLSPGGLAFKVGGRWQSMVGSPDRHIEFLEEGGTISGKQYLRIPTAAAQTAGGSDRNRGRSLRDVPGLFLLRSKRGKLWAAMSTHRGRAITLLYLLVRSVTMRPRGLFAAVAREMEPVLRALGGERVASVVRKANG